MEEPESPRSLGSWSDRVVRWFRNWKLVSWRSLFATLYVLYVLFGFFGVPPIVRNKAIKTLKERAGLEATIQKVRFNPFTLGLTIRGLSILDRPKSVIFSADEIYVNAESFMSVLRWAGTLKQLRVENPMVAVRRYSDGKINLVEVMREVQRRSPPPPPDAKKGLPRLYLQNIGINGAVVTLEDAARPKPMTMRFGPSVLSLARISTIPDHQGTDEVTIQLPGAGTVRASGNVVVQPMGLEGDVTLEGLQLKSLWPLMEPYFEFRVEGGVASGKFHYAVSAPESGLRVSIRGFENEVKDVLLVDQGEKIVEVGRIALKDGSFQWPEAAVGVGLLRVENSAMLFRREADGHLAWERMVPKKTRETAVETYQEVEKAAKWVVDVGKIESVDSRGRFQDKTFTPPVMLEATNIELAITGFTTRPGKKWTVVSSATFPKGATTKTNGKASLGPPTFESDVELNGFDLSVPQPYVSLFAPLEPTGKAGTKGRLAGGIDPQKGPWVNFKGDAEVVTTAVKETVTGSTPVKWKAVKAGGIDVGYGPLGASLKTLDIRGAVLEIVMSEKGTISITEVQKAMAKGKPGEKVPEPEPAAEASSQQMPIKIGTIRLRDCTGAFTDRRMKPAFTAALDRIEGTIQGIDSTSKTPTKIDIAATVRGGGAVTLKGSLDVFEPFRATEFKLAVDKAEIPPMSPMSIYYVGHPITLGQSTIALDYTVKQKQLNGTNHLGTQDLTLGDKVEGQGKISLPIGLGISLLTDKEGRITLDFPVQADLNDPKLSIAKAAGAATSAVVSEIVKNPFRLLSGLGGGKDGGKGGDDLSFVEFAAGKSDLEPAAAERLKTLVAGMGARPQLKLVVAGVWDESVDGAALKEVALEKRIAQKAPGEATAPSIATLESLYQESGGKPEAMAALRQSHTSGAAAGGKPTLDEGAYEEELRKAILEAQPVGPAEYQALGHARAASVQAGFGQAGLEAARLEMAAAHAATGSAGTRVRLPLEVAGAGAAAAPAPTRAAEKASAAPSSPQ